jgi:hypothetical protein
VRAVLFVCLFFVTFYHRVIIVTKNCFHRNWPPRAGIFWGQGPSLRRKDHTVEEVATVRRTVQYSTVLYTVLYCTVVYRGMSNRGSYSILGSASKSNRPSPKMEGPTTWAQKAQYSTVRAARNKIFALSLSCFPCCKICHRRAFLDRMYEKKGEKER